MSTPRDAVALSFARIASDGRSGIWIELVDQDVALAEADRVESALSRGAELPLAGVTLAVKNNIDVRGLRTTAACKSFGTVPAANAPVVQTLVDAGAVVIGVTNLDQFATGLVGTRSPYGICPNAHWPELISGGSSSGSAVAVAAGHVDLALGTDTAGSGRVPAAANGIFGIKPTRERVSTKGIVPACRSFDCASLFGRDLGLLRSAFALVATDPETPKVVGGPVRFAVPSRDQLTFDGDAVAAERFAAAVTSLVSATAATAVDVDLAPFLTAGRLLYEGALVIERYEAVGAFIDAHPDDVDPVVYSIIHPARDLSRTRLAEDRAELVRLRSVTAPLWDRADVLVVPSVPRLPSTAEVLADPIKVNSMLGTYTNFVNLLGLCAVTIPVGEASAGHPPASVTLIAPADGDELLIAVADQMSQPSV